jgi:uncharacterized protein
MSGDVMKQSSLINNTAELAVRFDPAVLDRICRSNHVRRLSLFGSVLHRTATAESDVDLLVEFQPHATPGLFRVVALEQELSKLLGRRVDLRTAEDLSRYFREEVVAEARPLYETD